MKMLLAAFVLLVTLATFLSTNGCSPIDGGESMRYDPARYTDRDYSMRDKDIFREGYRMGRLDARNGLSRSFVRHQALYDEDSKYIFGEGYGKGYQNYSAQTTAGYGGP